MMKFIKKEKFTVTTLYKILVIFFAILLIVTNVPKIFHKIYPKTYTTYATVVEIIPEDSEIYTICFQLVNNKHIYCVETSENYEIGENYNITFNTKNTETILDDEIIEIKRPI